MDQYRFDIIKKNHSFSIENCLKWIDAEGGLFYSSGPSYQAGAEFLLSNESNWIQETPFEPEFHDFVLGFGTNSLWDIALDSQAEQILIADWSPWPLIAHSLVLGPLIRIAQTREEFIVMIGGLCPEVAQKLSLNEAFDLVREFTLSPLNQQLHPVSELLVHLAESKEVSDFELQFLTTYLRPRLGDNLNPHRGYGPFYDLKNPNSANLSFLLESRYRSQEFAARTSVFSSLENFYFLKRMFEQKRISYAWAGVLDLDFYKMVINQMKKDKFKNLAISISNIFDCGHYNSLDQNQKKQFIQDLKKVSRGADSKCDLVIFLYETLGREAPYEFQRQKFN